jgi:hypothetical protein
MTVVAASLLLSACTAPAPPAPPAPLGSSADRPMGPVTTAVVGVYDRIVKMAADRTRDDLPVDYDGASGTFGATGGDPIVEGLALTLNALPDDARATLGARWAGIRAQSAALFQVLVTADEATVSYNGTAGSWLTDPVVGEVYRAPVDRLQWVSPTVTCEAVVGPLRAIVSAFAGVSGDGSPERAIDLSVCQEDGGDRRWVTHDPPSDGTTVNCLPLSCPGSLLLSHAVAQGGIGCVPVGESVVLGEPCTLMPTTTGFPNYTIKRTIDSSGTVWVAFHVAKITGKDGGLSSICPSQFQCVLGEPTVFPVINTCNGGGPCIPGP